MQYDSTSRLNRMWRDITGPDDAQKRRLETAMACSQVSREADMLKSGTFRALVRNLRKANEMPTKKTSATKKGAKTRTKPTAGKTMKKATGTGFPRTLNGWVAFIVARDKRRPGFLRALRDALDAAMETPHTRAAAVRPRTNAPEPAGVTH